MKTITPELADFLASSNIYSIYDEYEFSLRSIVGEGTYAGSEASPAKKVTMTSADPDVMVQRGDLSTVVMPQGLTAPKPGILARPRVGAIQVTGRSPPSAPALLDNMTGSAGTILSNHVTDSGHTWVPHGVTNLARYVLDGTGNLRNTLTTGGVSARSDRKFYQRDVDARIYWSANLQVAPANFVFFTIYEAVNPLNNLSVGINNSGGNLSASMSTTNFNEEFFISQSVAINLGNKTTLFANGAMPVFEVLITENRTKATFVLDGANKGVFNIQPSLGDLRDIVFSMGSGTTANSVNLTALKVEPM